MSDDREPGVSRAERDWRDQLPTPTDELTRVAAQVRALMQHMLSADTADPRVRAALGHAADCVRDASDALAPHARVTRAPRMGPPIPDSRERPEARPYYVQGPLIGDHHPMAPPIRVEHVDGATRGRVEFPIPFEGPPGCVHGGFVSFFFDLVLGHHNVAAGIPAMTGTLTVKYRAPTPLMTALDFAVHTEKVSGRKVVTHGSLLDDGRIVAEADGLFVLPGQGFREKFRETLEAPPLRDDGDAQ